MSTLADLKPAGLRTVMALVAEAGHDVSAWAMGKGGAVRAARNPRYCYEWAFFQTGKSVILNLWHASFYEKDGRLFCRFDAISRLERLQASGRTLDGTVIKRARRAVNHLVSAQLESLPIRVIILDGRRRGYEVELGARPKPTARDLDPTPWAVHSRDHETGDWLLVRGEAPMRIRDQFSDLGPAGAPAPVVTRTGVTRLRDASARERVRVRACGCCEWCGAPGFPTSGDERYIEVHHLIGLAEDGPDHPSNMIALCPNHHREVHHARNRDDLKAAMQAKVARFNAAMGDVVDAPSGEH